MYLTCMSSKLCKFILHSIYTLNFDQHLINLMLETLLFLKVVLFMVDGLVLAQSSSGPEWIMGVRNTHSHCILLPGYFST